MAPSYDEQSLVPALKLMTKANASLLASGTFYVAEPPNGDLVGCGGWTLEQPGTGAVAPHLAHIRHVAVDPSWTRRGIGTALYAFCESAARAAGVRAFECYSSLNAEKFYAALGFKRVRELDLELQSRVMLHAVLMRRDLEAAGGLGELRGSAEVHRACFLRCPRCSGWIAIPKCPQCGLGLDEPRQE